MSILPKISVIIPTHNRAKTIKYCLESVLDQTFETFEVIVVDDCSTDDTVKIVKQYNDPRIRCIVLPENLGAQAARNRGIREAKADWIAFLDSDDKWILDKLNKQYRVLSQHNFDPYLVAHTDCFRYYPKTRKYSIWNLSEAEGDWIYPQILKEPGPMFQGLLVSKIALEKIGYLDNKVPSYQEWDTMIRLAKICKFIHIKDPLFVYFFHEGETISKDRGREIAGYQYIITKFRDDIKKYCGEEVWQEHLQRQILRCLELEIWSESNDYLKLLSHRGGKFYIYKLCCMLHIRFEVLKGIIKTIKSTVLFYKSPRVIKVFKPVKSFSRKCFRKSKELLKRIVGKLKRIAKRILLLIKTYLLYLKGSSTL